MPAEVTQANRLLSISTPLGEDILLINSVVVSERVSGLFHISLDLLATPANAGAISGQALVGKEVSVRCQAGGQDRYFHGIVSRFSEGNRDERFQTYKTEVVPWFWLLSLTANCRIFQDKSVPTIIEDVFKEAGFQNFRNTLTAAYEKWDYCVQYRETSFDFLSRLMEEEGIFYYFEHEERKHTLVLADTPQAFKPCPGQAAARYVPEVGTGEDEDVVLSWQKSQLLRPGSYTLRDYHFETPAKKYEVNEPTMYPLADNKKLGIFDYPGDYAQKYTNRTPAGVDAEAKKIVRLRMEEQESAHEIYEGTTYCRALRAGTRFELTGHSKLSGQYSITAIQHTAVQSPAYVSDMIVDPAYSNSVSCIPFGSHYRPARLTPQPVVQGPQTAVVVGPAGEEIWTDKFSRVKVQFHWDRQGKNNDQSSCWIRVAQASAGSKWGAIFIPRIGHEVIVDFLEGDPDQPIIIGSVYNNAQMPPYELPANQTQSGYKSRSSKNGASANFNELRYEDKKGSEDIYFHAEKDFHRVVENDDDLKVGHDQTIEIQNHRTEVVKKGEEKVTIELGNRLISVDTGNDTKNVKKGNREAVIDMGNDSLTIKMGNQTTKINLGKSETEAMQSIELKVGQSSVKLDQMGVTIKGMMIKIEGQVQVDVKGLMTNVSGDAMLVLKGGITMIN
ncbi:MAG TPA: type VI secretion system tip protein VgrG [Bryobacteraceae bacterium]|nr:type VI secretion system tip protein VgrG [Bryobacteraceae bacterium]